MIFSKLKTYFTSDKKEGESEYEKKENLAMQATLGIEIGDLITINQPSLEFARGLTFELGEPMKQVTGISVYEDNGMRNVRVYTNDDYFIQFDYFGDNHINNLESIKIFKYEEDEGSYLEANSDECLDQWVSEVSEMETYSPSNKNQDAVYQSITDLIGGLEVVDLLGGDINTLKNNFFVFQQDVSGVTEFAILNAEESLTTNEDGEIVDRDGITISAAFGVELSHTSIKVNKKGTM